MNEQLKNAALQGVKDFLSGRDLNRNPYTEPELVKAWEEGWWVALRAYPMHES